MGCAKPGGDETPVLTMVRGDAGQSFVTYIKAEDRYIIVFSHQRFEDVQAKQSGFYASGNDLLGAVWA